ncbi:hypothetical protein THRCLA_22322 [Thraustotheca clavata]|uniref:Dolichol-phosphate mannosyltransferase subunit 1 n=1 Tax=Thraustotheca clavata TaxID=74557 RepID=A0A1V9Z5J5_9STRA|nr:hypothetical protein THRCLA_22322 [Thraustotheca clavata]
MAGKINATIVVPTYKECANLEELVTRVFKALGDDRAKTTEIIVVDDNSSDGSEDVIKKLASKGYNVQIIVRTTERGLSSAVLRGFKEARGQLLLCMDADLQHPPESVPELIDAIDPAKGNAEFVIGTRYGGAGFSVDKDWPLHRKLASSGARMLARPLSALSDPMTGFFGLPAEVFARPRAGEINPIGFKIALELFVKCRVKRHAEVPINFGVRLHGESKLTGKVIVQYLQHLYDLYDFAYPSLPWILFLIFLTLVLLTLI